jgi:heme exporter protein CcmD
MDPVLEEVYSTVLSGAPYVIGAYALIWVVLMVFVIMMLNRSRKTQKDIDALRESIERRKGRTSRPDDDPAEGRSEH